MSYLFSANSLFRTDACGITAYPFTISAWMRTTSTAGAFRHIAGISDASADGLAAILVRDPADTDARAWSMKDDPPPLANPSANTSTQYSINTWHHVLAVFASDTSRTIYLDDAGADTSVGAATYQVGMDRFTLGQAYTSGSPRYSFDGYIAEVGLWDVALSSANITSLAAGAVPSSVDAGNIVAYWPLLTDTNDDINSFDLTKSAGANPPSDPEHPTMIQIDYDEGELAVSATASVVIAGLTLTYDQEELAVSATASVAIVGESSQDTSTYPEGRPTDYDPDKTWDETSATWSATFVSVVQNRTLYFVVVGEHGEIYFNEDT